MNKKSVPDQADRPLSSPYRTSDENVAEQPPAADNVREPENPPITFRYQLAIGVTQDWTIFSQPDGTRTLNIGTFSHVDTLAGFVLVTGTIFLVPPELDDALSAAFEQANKTQATILAEKEAAETTK